LGCRLPAEIRSYSFNCELGTATVRESEGCVVGLELEESAPLGSGEPTALALEVERQLREYFAGERREFDLPLAPEGTPFQRAVWAELQNIPYGETRSYGEVATAVGNPRACRAVGAANNRNPLGIIVPCHRVVGSDGSLVGYATGIDHKRHLLELEANTAQTT